MPFTYERTIRFADTDAAGFATGDVVAVRATGPGCVEVLSVRAFIEEYAGCLDAGGELREIVEEMGAEWD